VLWAKSLAAATDQFVDVGRHPGLRRGPGHRLVLLGGPVRPAGARRGRPLAPEHRGGQRHPPGRRAPVRRGPARGPGRAEPRRHLRVAPGPGRRRRPGRRPSRPAPT
jgi:hypothetical protein